MGLGAGVCFAVPQPCSREVRQGKGPSSSANASRPRQRRTHWLSAESARSPGENGSTTQAKAARAHAVLVIPSTDLHRGRSTSQSFMACHNRPKHTATKDTKVKKNALVKDCTICDVVGPTAVTSWNVTNMVPIITTKAHPMAFTMADRSHMHEMCCVRYVSTFTGDIVTVMFLVKEFRAWRMTSRWRSSSSPVACWTFATMSLFLKPCVIL
mmetsp:Transcript_56750/g.137135  ORF Transcript_56750/g.137135 Transcript_56750/m.137135 type:complete len:212 (+) Transcript_56750:499-1134(+)